RDESTLKTILRDYMRVRKAKDDQVKALHAAFETEEFEHLQGQELPTEISEALDDLENHVEMLSDEIRGLMIEVKPAPKVVEPLRQPSVSQSEHMTRILEDERALLAPMTTSKRKPVKKLSGKTFLWNLVIYGILLGLALNWLAHARGATADL